MEGALDIVNKLGDCEVHDSGDGGDSLVLCQVEGAHGKVSGAVVHHSESRVSWTACRSELDPPVLGSPAEGLTAGQTLFKCCTGM